MADDGSHYAAYTDVQRLLNNAGLGVAGNTMYDEDSLVVALDVTQAVIHMYLGIDVLTKLTSPATAIAVLKGIQIDLINMQILRARNMNENNLSDFSQTIQFWQITPYLTNSHKELLDMVRDQRDGTAWAFNTRTGYEVTN